MNRKCGAAEEEVTRAEGSPGGGPAGNERAEERKVIDCDICSASASFFLVRLAPICGTSHQARDTNLLKDPKNVCFPVWDGLIKAVRTSESARLKRSPPARQKYEAAAILS